MAVHRPAGRVSGMFEQNVSSERYLQLKQAKHEPKMISSLSQATIEFSWGHSEFCQVHDIQEICAHWTPNQQLRACFSYQFLSISAPCWIIKIPKLSE